MKTRYKIPLNKHPEICQYYLKGDSSETISKIYDVSSVTIRNILKKCGVQMRDMRECHRLYPMNENYFDNIDSEHKAYFLGLLLADGCKHGNRIIISLQEQDKSILKHMAAEIYSVPRPLSFIKTKRDKRGFLSKNKWGLYINSKHMADTLMSHGIVERKTFITVYPPHLPNSLFPHFLRGYFDGDGTVYTEPYRNNPSIKYIRYGILGTKKLLQSLKAHIHQWDKSIRINMYPAKTIYYLKINWQKDIKAICALMYKDATIYLLRKKEKFDKYYSEN